MNEVLKRILCLNKGNDDKTLELGLKLKPKTVNNWKRGLSEGYMKMLPQIADYFDVSVDYLLGRTDNPAPIIHPSNEYIPDGIIKMPVIGVISAGYDGEAVEEVIDNVGILAISLHGYSPEDCFLLRVRGDSMYPDFREGDLIVAHRQTSVDSGDVAVVLFNGDSATLKRVEYESGKDWMKLIPRNPDYQEKVIKGIELNECRILGKVISLVYREIV